MFSTVISGIYDKIDSDEWTALELPTYPGNYQGDIPSGMHARVSIIGPFGDRVSYKQGRKYVGKLVLSVYFKAGEGDLPTAIACDKIAEIFDNLRLPNGTEFSIGSITNHGLDSGNKSLWRVDYSNNFTIFGE